MQISVMGHESMKIKQWTQINFRMWSAFYQHTWNKNTNVQIQAELADTHQNAHSLFTLHFSGTLPTVGFSKVSIRTNETLQSIVISEHSQPSATLTLTHTHTSEAGFDAFCLVVTILSSSSSITIIIKLSLCNQRKRKHWIPPGQLFRAFPQIITFQKRGVCVSLPIKRFVWWSKSVRADSTASCNNYGELGRSS